MRLIRQIPTNIALIFLEMKSICLLIESFSHTILSSSSQIGVLTAKYAITDFRFIRASLVFIDGLPCLYGLDAN